MITTNYVINGQGVSYEIFENGYNIHLGEKLWITQQEPYIPYSSLGYEGSCLKQIEELTNQPDTEEVSSDYEIRLSALEEENAMLYATLDDILTNIIPAVTGESEV